MLRAVGVGYRYAGRGGAAEAVADANLEVAPGEVVAVLGPNGAGKSTLLRLLDGGIEPARGHVERPAARTPEGRLAYGWLGEDAPHFEVLSGRENALFFARAAGLGRSTARAEAGALLERLLPGGEADRPVLEYSFGARRKLALVEALAHRPAVVLLDEPTTGLDLPSRGTLAGLLRQRAEEGAAVLVSSHDTGFVEEAADRVVFMVRGRTRPGGSPAGLVDALGGRERILVTLAEPPEGARRLAGPGWAVVRPGNPLVIEAERGRQVLPDVCRTLAAAGGVIRAITVRPAGLADVFREATGEDLAPAGDAAS